MVLFHCLMSKRTEPSDDEQTTAERKVEKMAVLPETMTSVHLRLRLHQNQPGNTSFPQEPQHSPTPISRTRRFSRRTQSLSERPSHVVVKQHHNNQRNKNSQQEIGFTGQQHYPQSPSALSEVISSPFLLAAASSGQKLISSSLIGFQWKSKLSQIGFN